MSHVSWLLDTKHFPNHSRVHPRTSTPAFEVSRAPHDAWLLQPAPLLRPRRACQNGHQIFFYPFIHSVDFSLLMHSHCFAVVRRNHTVRCTLGHHLILSRTYLSFRSTGGLNAFGIGSGGSERWVYWATTKVNNRSYYYEESVLRVPHMWAYVLCSASYRGGIQSLWPW